LRKLNTGKSNQLQSFDVASSTYAYSYDANGNQIQENTDRYFEWNYADKLAFYKRQAGGSNPSVWVHYLGACPERESREQ
jgi:YD repeat-containing protein